MPDNKPLQTDERRAWAMADPQVTLAPLAAEPPTDSPGPVIGWEQLPMSQQGLAK